jgi:GTP-binding protein
MVAIIGKPNVGKSTLFNRILRTRKSIVEDVPGVTRDRVYGEANWEDRSFVVIDTGGLYPDAEEEIFSQIKEQTMFAIQEADLILMMFDAKEGLTETDREIMKLLRDVKKPILYVVNKIDSKKAEQSLYDFYELGVDELIPLSATTGRGFGELMDRVVNLLPDKKEEEVSGDIPRIAIIGKPNVGKSTILNALLGKERMIVSPIPGTTRDAVDSVCRYYGKEYILIDTAGLRKKAKVSYSIERYMVLRAIRSIERSDLVLLMIDAIEGITEQDQKLASLTQRYGKGLIILFNKWDLVEDPEKRYKELMAQFERELHFVNYAPVLTVSGVTKKRLTKIFPIIDEVIRERRKRIPTSELNRFAAEITPMLPTHKGKKTKIYYITQPEIEPPGFVIFVNYPSALKASHIRFIEKRLREKYIFKGTPIEIKVRKKS